MIVGLDRRAHILKRFPQPSRGDQVAYDSGLMRYYITVAVHTSAGAIAVIDAITHREINRWKVGTVTTHWESIRSHIACSFPARRASAYTPRSD